MDLGFFCRHHEQRQTVAEPNAESEKSSFPSRPATVSDPHATQILIQQVQQGDRAALDELCDRYLMRVLAVVRIRLGAKLREKVESCDIVQEVMIDALGKIKSFDFRTEGAFLKFLNQVVENRIRDEADRWAAQKRSPDREVPLNAPRSDGERNPLDIVGERSAQTPSKVVSVREDLERLELAMDRLGEKSAEYRDLIVAIKIEGRTYREIAEENQSTEDAVRMRAKRAMLSLATIYKDLDKEA
jgi:RNA polymerase sigma-70 factor (subfamily 1)